MSNNCKRQSQLLNILAVYDGLSTVERFLYSIVARVRPRTSKGITDLLLLFLQLLY